LCDSFFQLIVGMGLHTSSENQEKNIQKLLSLLLKTSHDYSSPSAPIVTFDKGYGKMSLILPFLERQFKIITVCAAVGSGHPFVSQLDIKAHIDHQQKLGNSLQISNISEIIEQLSSWTVYDKENILRGPEIKVATKVCTQVQAIAYRDIFDKKKAQKILRFFTAGFSGIENAVCHWEIIGKTNKAHSFPTSSIKLLCQDLMEAL
jgi:hypothetical protein